MAFLKSLGPKRTAEVKESQVLRASYSASLPPANIWRSSWSSEGSIDKALLATTWVFRAATAIAQNQAKLPIVIREGDRFKGPEIEDHPLALLLNDRPNSYERAVQFRFRLSLQLLLSKRGAFVEVERDNADAVIGLHLGDPDRISPIRSQENYVSGYELRAVGGQKTVLPPEDVVWIRAFPHPTNIWDGMSPLEPLGISVDIDRYARAFQRNYLSNDGKLGGVISINGEMDDSVADEIMAHLAAGPASAGKWLPVEADGMSILDFGSNPRDAQYVEQRNQTKAEILQGFGVPESVAGDSSNRTFDNAEQELLGFWRETMHSHTTMLASPFDALCEPGYFVGFDFGEIAVLQRDKRQFEIHLMELFDAGLITIDEFREETGREPNGTPGSEAFYLGINKVPVAQDTVVPPAPPAVVRSLPTSQQDQQAIAQ